MVRLLKGMTVLGAITVVAVCASPAPAAKGLKKTHEHLFWGTVISVHHAHKKGHHGNVTIRVTKHKHRKGLNVAKVVERTFTINRHTHVVGTEHMRVHGLAALHPGEHVTVFAHHHHADRIVIHHHHRKAKKIA